MSSRPPRQRIQDMIDAIARIRSYTSGMDYQQFVADTKTVDAVVRNLELIGEASRRVPSSYLTNFLEDDWRRIGDMRNKLIHDYADTNVDLVWQTVCSRLDALEIALQAMLERLADRET